MNTTTKHIGNAGEEQAFQLLASKGYAIIDRNVTIGGVEVDILAQNATRIIIVEVKTRREDHLDVRFGIDREKLRRLCRAGSSYVRTHNLPHEVQIDLILITNHPDGTSSVEHLEDVALPPRRPRRAR